MYCSACGTPMAPELSFCNRCGMSLKQSSDSKTTPADSYLTAITIIGIGGLALVLGGAIALRNGAQFNNDIVGVFMLMAFAIIGIVEISLCRQLSRLNSNSEKRLSLETPVQRELPPEFRTSQTRVLPEPVPSVTENTTRTLEYSRNEPSR